MLSHYLYVRECNNAKQYQNQKPRKKINHWGQLAAVTTPNTVIPVEKKELTGMN